MDEWAQILHQPLRDTLLNLNPRGLAIAAVDKGVDAAAARAIPCANLPTPDALITLWLDSHLQSEAFISKCEAHAASTYAWLVTESQPLLRTETQAVIGERSPGMCQVVLMQKPEHLAREQWLQNWLGDHTPVAIETQSTWRYQQNLVQRALTPESEGVDAIVEENFPAEAMSDDQVFYNAPGDAEKTAARQQCMIESCSRFIDFEKLCCVPMSETRYREH